MKKRPTLKDLDEFESQLYCTIEDVYKIAPMTRAGARQLVNTIVDEMLKEGLPPISCKPLMVPTYRVMERLDLRKG